MIKLFENESDNLATIFIPAYSKGRKILERTLRRVGKKWKKRFPKRKLRWLDAMGVVTWDIDGVSIHDAFPARHHDPRIQAILQPLLDVQWWYCEMSDRYGDIGVSDLKFE